MISGVAAAAADGTATITWSTDEPSTSQVEFGLDTSYGTLTPVDPVLVTSHTVTLSGLSLNTLYHYRVRSRDASLNERISGDGTFMTTAAAATAVVAFGFEEASGTTTRWTAPGRRSWNVVERCRQDSGAIREWPVFRRSQRPRDRCR